MNKKADVVRIIFADANTLLSFQTTAWQPNYINLIVAANSPRRSGLRSTGHRALHHRWVCGRGRQTTRATRSGDGLCGDVPTMETLCPRSCFWREQVPICASVWSMSWT